jgi:hypothetical protein
MFITRKSDTSWDFAVNLSPDDGNAIIKKPNGLYVDNSQFQFLVSVDNTSSISLSGTGIIGDPILATTIISPNAGNILQSLPNGLFVAPDAIDFITGIIDTSSIDLINTAGILSAEVNLSPDAGNSLQSLGNGLFSPSITSNNGLSLDGTSIVLGQDVGDPLNPAQLISDREIPLNGNDITLTGSGIFSSPSTFFGDVDSTPSKTTFLQWSNTFNYRNKTNPLNGLCFPSRNRMDVSFTSAPPTSVTTSTGLFNAVIAANNTQNWPVSGAPSTSHPSISGLTGTVESINGASGTIAKASTYFGTIAITSGLTIDEANLIDVTYQHSGTINHANGIRIADTDAGTNGVGVFLVNGDSSPSPSGHWDIYSQTGYPSHLGGALETVGLDTYTSDISGSFTNLTKITKGYADSTYLPITSGLQEVTDIGNTTTNDIKVTGGIASNIDHLIVGDTHTNSDIWKLLINRDSTNPTLLPEAERIINITSYTTTPPTGSIASGLAVFSQVGSTNTQNWPTGGAPLTKHSSLVAIRGIASANSGATGIIPRASSYFGTIAGTSGVTYDEAIIMDLTFDHTTIANYAVALALRDLDIAGANNTALFLTIGDSTPPPTGNWSIYDSLGYNSYFNGSLQIGSATSLGSEKLQVTGNSILTGTLTVNTLATGSTSDFILVNTAGLVKQVNPSTYIPSFVSTPTLQQVTTAGNTTTNSIGISVSPLYKLDINGGSTALQLHLSTGGTDDGTYIGSNSTSDAVFSESATYNGSNWIAKGTSAGFYAIDDGVHAWYSNTGLTAGNSFTPTERVRITSSGLLGIGTASPTAVLHLKAGTATANTSPLKFTSGTNLTTPEAGAIEWNGTNLFITQTTGPTRKQIAYTTDIPSTPTLQAVTTAGNSTGNDIITSGSVYSLSGVYGGTTASASLTLGSTSNATKGKILFGTSAYDEVNNRLGIGTTSPVGIQELYQSTIGVGTISVTASGTTVTGTGTFFLYDFNIGDTITANSETRTITAIASNTSMTTTAWTNTFSGAYTLAGGSKCTLTEKGTMLFGNTAPVATSARYIHAATTITNGSSVTGINISPTLSNTTLAGTTGLGITSTLTLDPTNTQNWVQLLGFNGSIFCASGSTGTITNTFGLTGGLQNSSSGLTITNAIGIRAGVIANSGTITSSRAGLFYGLNLATNNTGLHLTTGASTTAAPSGNYGIYDDTNYQSYFAGNIGVGITSPTSALHISRATTVAANIKLDSGSIVGEISYNDSDQIFKIINRGTFSGSPTTTSYLGFYTNNDSTTPKMIIQRLGNIGIGTTSPNYTGFISNSKILTVLGGTGDTSPGCLELYSTGTASSTTSQLGSIVLGGLNGGSSLVGSTDINGYLDGATNSTKLVIATMNAGSRNEVLTITKDGRIYGSALHNNTGAVTGTTNQYIASGTYTPTLTNGANIVSTTPHQCQWLRVGNVVTVSGGFFYSWTTNSVTTNINISLPIATTINNAYNLAGSCHTLPEGTAITGGVGIVYGDTTNNNAITSVNSAVNFSNDGEAQFQFTYLIQ